MHRLIDLNADICDENQQKQHTGYAIEALGNVGGKQVECGGYIKENNRNGECLFIHAGWLDCDGNCRDQRRIADDGTDGVSVGDFTMAADCRGGGNHDLRQGSADGNDRCAD